MACHGTFWTDDESNLFTTAKLVLNEMLEIFLSTIRFVLVCSSLWPPVLVSGFHSIELRARLTKNLYLLVVGS